jgi:heterotetrameric sarcosine oxidase gamma subunit
VADTIETAFAVSLAKLGAGDGRLLVSERTGLGIASIMARAGQAEPLIARIAATYGIEAIDGPSRVAADGGRAMIGVGPGAWLFVKEDAPADWANDVADGLAGFGSVFDQSSAYAVLRLEGPAAATLIGKGAFLDLHPGVFPPGSAAVTVIEHIGAIVWRIGPESFEIAAFRSFASSFWHWLITAAAAIGVTPQRI